MSILLAAIRNGHRILRIMEIAARARAGINPFTRQPIAFVPSKIKR
jgi:hypothetical protein